ncbi:MAG: response regulator [Actinobacteria bacterium]|nr:response regulator [Actinomycetota bacterium]MCB0962141.1 response regulator [Acidimicrobiales bacterium]
MAVSPTAGTVQVVIADDDDRFASVVVRALARAGFRCATAASGEDALRLVDELDPALVVLDVAMPAPDGFEVCRMLRSRHWPGRILIATARSRVEDRQRALDLGADGFLTKPFPLAELLDVVEGLVPPPTPVDGQPGG